MIVTKVISLLTSVNEKASAVRKNALKQSYDIEVLDELLTPNLHILLVKVDEKHVDNIKIHPFVRDIHDQPKLSF